MEEGVYGEWDFTQGIMEGWIPTLLPPSHVSAKEVYNTTCMDIYYETNIQLLIPM